MLKGMTVSLQVLTDTGQTDDFNRSVYTESFTDVENVLVGQPTTDDITSSTDLHGKDIAYVLGIPKGDGHIWEDREVRFFGRRFKTFGGQITGIQSMIPLSWGSKINVEALE